MASHWEIVRRRIQDLEEQVDVLYGKRCGVLDEGEDREILIEAMVVELEAVRLAIDLNHAMHNAFSGREYVMEESQRLTGAWMRLELREESLRETIRAATSHQIEPGRIGWPSINLPDGTVFGRGVAVRLPARKAISPAPERRQFSREEKRDLHFKAGGRCSICRTKLGPDWHADHVTPYSRGGSTTVDNGQALCASCNLRKNDKVFD